MAAKPALVPLTVLFIAHRADEGLCNTLKKHLSPLMRQASIDIQLSYVSETQRSSTLADALDQDTVVLLLISPDLLASAACDHILSMLEEQSVSEGQIVPVLLRPASWEDRPLAKLQYLPHDGRPVTTWRNQDEAFLTITNELKETLQAFSPGSFQVPPSTGAGRSVSTQEQSYRERLLRRVHDYWIAGVLKQSQQTGEHLTHNLYMQPDAYANPWQKVMQESRLPGYDLPPGTRIIDVYDEVGRELLILGDPGSGKTTLLLELARDLRERAAQDISAPVPVYFHLSQWAEKRKPIDRWLVDELCERYDNIPKQIARRWIKTDRLHLLLDGLDEMADSIMPACIAALNEYLSEHGLASIALCCRLSSYLDQPARLRLHHAVVIEPLTEQQIDAYLASVDGGDELQAMLKQDDALRHMASTPLMLSILARTSRHISKALLGAGELTPALLQKRIFAAYVAEMLSRRGEHPVYTADKTRRWLAWLAWQMRKHNQSVFYLERIQPNWLSARRSRTIYYACIALLSILTFGSVCGLSVLVYGYVVWFLSLLGVLGGVSCLEFMGTIQPVRVMSRTARRGNVVAFLTTVLWFFISLGGMLSHSPQIDFIYILFALFIMLTLLFLIIAAIDLSVVYVIDLLRNAVRRRASESIAPDYDLKRSIRTEVLTGLLCSFLFIGIVWMVQMLPGSKGDFAGIYVLSAIFGLLCGLIFGGMAAIRLKMVQRLLRREGVMPDSYMQFLNYTTERLLLRGGGRSYTFVHILLRDYLAEQYEETERGKREQR